MGDPLDALRPLHEPPPISWWPPAPGWWIVLALVLMFIIGLYFLRRRNRIRRSALRELRQLARSNRNSADRAAQLNALLKRYALYCWPDAEIASLNGEQWLAFLDAQSSRKGFVNGSQLATLPYAHGGDTNLKPLFELARRWIGENRRGKALESF